VSLSPDVGANMLQPFTQLGERNLGVTASEASRDAESYSERLCKCLSGPKKEKELFGINKG
jgi:hypothetical protein